MSSQTPAGEVFALRCHPNSPLLTRPPSIETRDTRQGLIQQTEVVVMHGGDLSGTGRDRGSPPPLHPSQASSNLNLQNKGGVTRGGGGGGGNGVIEGKKNGAHPAP
jgi:hypothetical protein